MSGEDVKKEKLTVAEIKARLRVVCICKGIKMAKISEAIQKGCSTVEEVNRATGSGNGGCGATRCRPVIEELIKNGGRPITREELHAPSDYEEEF